MSEQDLRFSVLPAGERWPSGDCSEIALIDVPESEVQRIFGQKLTRGDEVGLGEWQAIGVKLNSGATIELIKYSWQKPSGFTLRADSQSSNRNMLNEVVALLGIKIEQVIWMSPSL